MSRSRRSTQVLGANNLTFPAGEVSDSGIRIPVSAIGRIATPADVEEMVVGFTVPTDAAPPTPITIGDLGTVEVTEVATTGYGRTDGQPSLSLTVTKTSDANTVIVAEAVQAKLDEIAVRHTDALTITTVSDLSSFIKESTDGLLREGGLGALFAVLTIFAFLRGIRATLVAAVSIPLSVLTALVVMQLTGISLNIMTLGGLAVAVGRVVDDAIVVLGTSTAIGPSASHTWTRSSTDRAKSPRPSRPAP